MSKKNLSPNEQYSRERAKHGAWFIVKLIGGLFLLLPIALCYEFKKTGKSIYFYMKNKRRKWTTPSKRDA